MATKSKHKQGSGRPHELVRLRSPHPGEECRLSMNHKQMTFTWRSEKNGDPLELPEPVAILMALRGMRQV
jgi:hypothetical protein